MTLRQESSIPWLRNIRDVYRIHKDESKIYNRLVELNVQEQCINLIKIASVQKAYKERHIHVHGWVFDLHSGKLIDLKLDRERKLKGFMEIYDLGKIRLDSLSLNFRYRHQVYNSLILRFVLSKSVCH